MEVCVCVCVYARVSIPLQVIPSLMSANHQGAWWLDEEGLENLFKICEHLWALAALGSSAVHSHTPFVLTAYCISFV